MANSKKKLLLNYLLVAITTVIFAIFALLFLYATGYVWFLSKQFPEYESSLVYAYYVSSMNYLATIPSLLIIILLILCLEKRSENHRLTGIYIALVMISSLVVFLKGDSKGAVGIIVGGAVFYQIYLLFKLFLSGDVVSEKIYKIEKAGSLIMHTGFSLLILAWVTFNSTAYELPFFWLATSLVALGSVLTFYGNDIAWIVRKIRKLFNLDL
jgi:hypothetical protein